jgi:hypothetical protein
MMVYDADAEPGEMTVRLLALCSAVQRRNSYKKRGKLTEE